MSWKFYGRSVELESLRKLLTQRRWFFCAISGRRRIGNRYGYARVSTQDQNLDLQIDALIKAGCKKLLDDKPRAVSKRVVALSDTCND